LTKLQNDGTFIWRINALDTGYMNCCITLSVDLSGIYLFGARKDLGGGEPPYSCFVLGLDGSYVTEWTLETHPRLSIINSDGNLVVSPGTLQNIISVYSKAGIKSGDYIVSRHYGSIFQDISNNYHFVDSGRGIIEIYDYMFSLSSTLKTFTSVTGGTLPYHFTYLLDITNINEDHVYVLDQNGHCVHIFDMELNWIADFGEEGSGNGQFELPSAIVADKINNEILVVDDGNDRIQRFDIDGVYNSQWDAAATDGAIDQADYIAIHPNSGDIYITMYAQDYVFRYESDGTYKSRMGGTGIGNGELTSPTAVAVDENGNVYVMDTVSEYNDRIQQFDDSGTYVKTFTINYGFAYPEQLYYPERMRYWNGRLYIADGNFAIKVYDCITGKGMQSIGKCVNGSNYGEFLTLISLELFPSGLKFSEDDFQLNESGELELKNASGIPGGNDTEVQFNDDGLFGGEADFTYNKGTNTQTVTNISTKVIKAQDGDGVALKEDSGTYGVTVEDDGDVTIKIGDNAGARKVIIQDSDGASILTIDSNGAIEAISSVKHDTTAVFDAVYDNGNSGAAKTIDWRNGNKQKITTTGSCTLTFTAPEGACSLTLMIRHENSATAYTYVYPANVDWTGHLKYVTQNSAYAKDIINFIYDPDWFGSPQYFATGNGDFGV
jgi:hypothetical protein